MAASLGAENEDRAATIEVSTLMDSSIVETPAQDHLSSIATLIFFLAILHSFSTGYFSTLAHKFAASHDEKIRSGVVPAQSASFPAGILGFLGEFEVVFGLWAVLLGVVMIAMRGWDSFVEYIAVKTDYSDPLFVVIIMFIASTRPVLKFSEIMLWKIAKLAGGNLTAWWLTILTAGPLLGSFITEPAAMTICAHLLAGKLYDLEPDDRLKYATIALLFVNISIGGLLTHFAAVPVIMVAAPWHWGFLHMFLNFGIKSILIIIINNFLYFLLFRRELSALQTYYEQLDLGKSIVGRFIDRSRLEREIVQIERSAGREAGLLSIIEKRYGLMKKRVKGSVLKRTAGEEVDPRIVNRILDQTIDEIKKSEIRRTLPGLATGGSYSELRDENWDNRPDRVPLRIMFVHIAFLIWTVFNSHEPVLFIAGFLFLLGFARITPQHQNRIDLKPPLMVGFFLSGLVIHAGMQRWWLSGLLEKTNELPLLFLITILTSFNDNAALTYLASLIPDFPENLRYIVMAGAVTGGGLTILANAPNPAGYSILGNYWKSGFSAIRLFIWAMIPTWVAGIIFYITG
jgi:hypothetical protein